MTNTPYQHNNTLVRDEQRIPKRNRFNSDWIVLASMLIFLMMLFLPVMISKRPMTWEPPNKKSFVRSVQIAFSPSKQQKHDYTPTPIVSLCADYFTFGNDYLVFYRFHSLLAQLTKTAFLWLLLRRLRVAGHYALGFAFLMAIWPSSIEAVMMPAMRGAIAISLFVYLSLWTTTFCEAKHWLSWMIVAGLAGIIAVGASPWGVILIPTIPTVAWWCKKPGETLKWKRLIIPECLIIAATFFSCIMSIL